MRIKIYIKDLNHMIQHTLNTILDSSSLAMISCLACAAMSHGVWPAIFRTCKGAPWANRIFGQWTDLRRLYMNLCIKINILPHSACVYYNHTRITHLHTRDQTRCSCHMKGCVAVLQTKGMNARSNFARTYPYDSADF